MKGKTPIGSINVNKATHSVNIISLSPLDLGSSLNQKSKPTENSSCCVQQLDAMHTVPVLEGPAS